MSTTSQRGGGLPLGRIAPPLISLLILFALWRLGYKWLAIPVVLALFAWYALLPRLARRRADRFGREALKLIATGKAAEVPRLARRSVLLQLVGSRAPIDAKLGLAYAQLGEHRTAVGCFESALPEAPATERPALQTGLAKALLVTGDLARAEAEGRAVLESGTRLPELLAVVARARIGLGKVDDWTTAYLDDAEQLSPGDDARAMIALCRVEAALATGRKAPALPEGIDSSQRFVRAWIHLVRGLMRHQRGDLDKARSSFERALSEDADDGFVSAKAREMVAELDGELPAGDGGSRDDALRRKRRKRR